MAKFEPFQLAGLPDQTIIINADLVRSLKPLPAPTGEVTRISFDGNHTVDVIGGGLEVAQRLARQGG